MRRCTDTCKNYCSLRCPYGMAGVKPEKHPELAEDCSSYKRIAKDCGACGTRLKEVNLKDESGKVFKTILYCPHCREWWED